MTTLRGPARQCSSNTMLAPIIVPMITPPSQLYHINASIWLSPPSQKKKKKLRKFNIPFGEPNQCITNNKVTRLSYTLILVRKVAHRPTWHLKSNWKDDPSAHHSHNIPSNLNGNLVLANTQKQLVMFNIQYYYNINQNINSVT